MTLNHYIIWGNTATDGGGIFFEEGGLAQGITSSSNTVDSIGGAGAFLWAGGTLRNGIIEGNIATNQYARGGAGIMFYDEGGLVEDSTIAGNISATNNGGIHYRYSGLFDPGTLGTVNNSILWSNGTQNVVWSGAGNQTVDPATTNSATGADIPSHSYASAGVKTTVYKYDLNGNILRREYPTGVVELRSFDALNRLSSITNLSAASAYSTVAYSHDAAGNLRQMTDSVFGLADVPQTAVYTWEYDDAYRLESEQVERASLPALRTEYDWDDAGNRLAKREYSGGVLNRTITYTTPNNLNQMLGWSDGTTNAVYSYNENGARTNATLTTASSTNTTIYAFDEDNRLIGVALDSTNATHSFAYDYRTRRYYRATPAETNLCVFDGGLSVQEYDASQSLVPQASNLQVEYLRGPNLGGGVGGMVYSIRSDGIRCSHANHRGDVVVRTGSAGQLIWFARYAAYGTRFDEAGSNPDRQMSNTKDEERDLDLSNQNLRYYGINDGVWLTPDPIGFADGPNRYAYVHCNPITGFDAKGLWTFSIGWSLTGGLAAGGTKGSGYVIGYSRENGFQFGEYSMTGVAKGDNDTPYIGAGGAANIDIGFSNNDSIDKLGGESTGKGGSAGPPGAGWNVGGEKGTTKDGDAKPTYTISGGGGAGINWEGHKFEIITDVTAIYGKKESADPLSQSATGNANPSNPSQGSSNPASGGSTVSGSVTPAGTTPGGGITPNSEGASNTAPAGPPVEIIADSQPESVAEVCGSTVFVPPTESDET